MNGQVREANILNILGWDELTGEKNKRQMCDKQKGEKKTD